MTNTNNTNQKFNSILKNLKKSRGARQALAEEAVKIALQDINTANNVTKLNLLLLGDCLENNEVKLIREWLISESNIERLSVGKSSGGNATVKVVYAGEKINFKDDALSLYTFQLKKKESVIKPFDDASLIEAIARLIKKAESNGLDFTKALKLAKNKTVK